MNQQQQQSSVGNLKFEVGGEQVFAMEVIKKANGNGFAFEGVVYEYKFTDHLGNVKKGSHTVKRATSHAKLVQAMLQNVTTEPRKPKQTVESVKA